MNSLRLRYGEASKMKLTPLVRVEEGSELRKRLLSQYSFTFTLRAKTENRTTFPAAMNAKGKKEMHVTPAEL